MEDQLEASVYGCLNDLKDFLTLFPETTLSIMIKDYPDLLEMIEAEVANRQVQDFLMSLDKAA